MSVYSIRLLPNSENNEIISDLMFGAVQTGFQHFSGFRASMDHLGLSHVRWPGGTLAEQRPEVYGLTVPGLFDATDLYATDPDRVRPDLQVMLQYAIGRDVPLTIIIPTARYAEDHEKGASDLQAFLAALLSGAYGELPGRLILQIGNEYAFQSEFAGDPSLYGELANRFVSTIEDALHSADLPSTQYIQIAVQMGVSHSDDNAIRREFSERSLLAVDLLTFNHLPISLANLHRVASSGDAEDLGQSRFQLAAEYYQNWTDAVRLLSSAAPAPDLYLSAWTVGSPALSTSDVALAFNDYGLRAASTGLDLIYNYSRIGVDIAAVWGVDVMNLSRLTFASSGQLSVSPLGELVGMMAANVVGTVAMSGSEGYSRTDLGNVYAFRGPEKLVLYATVNDIPESGKQLTIDLDGVAPSWTLSGRMLQLDLAEGGGSESALNGGLSATAALSAFAPGWVDGGLQIKFLQDFAVAEILIEIPQTAQWGTGMSDILVSAEEDSFLFGYEGDDRLISRGGDDYLDGGPGNDVLDGGSGSNILIGGEGDDVFIFRFDRGDHEIRDFMPGEDTLAFINSTSSLSAEGTIPGEIISAVLLAAEARGPIHLSLEDTQEGVELRAAVGGNQTIIHLDGLSAADLSADDFWLV
jgi:hypothetical protein